MTTLSLFDAPQDAFDPHALRGVPNAPGARAQPGAEVARPALAGGLTLPVLAFAALVASPAIWQCLVRHALPLHVMLERYVVIALGCLLVSEAARRLIHSTSPDPRASTTAGGAADLSAAGGPMEGDTLATPLGAPLAPPVPPPAVDPALNLLATEG